MWPLVEPGGPVHDNAPSWVRFHTLPEAERYARTEEQAEIMLKRYNTILTELAGDRSVLVITSEWSDTQTPLPRSASDGTHRDSDVAYWQTIIQTDDPNPAFRSYRHVYVSRKIWSPGSLDTLFLAVGGSKAAGVMVVPEDLRWLYKPYDGGVDVGLQSTNEGDWLRCRHPGWLSGRDDGL